MGLPPPQPPEPVVGTLGGGKQWAAASAASFGRKARAARARDRQAAAEAKAIPCPPTEAIKLLAARLWRGRFDALRGGVIAAAAEARRGGGELGRPRCAVLAWTRGARRGDGEKKKGMHK